MMGIHLVHEIIRRVVPLLNERKRLIFAPVNALALLLDEFTVVLKWLTVSGVNGVDL